MSDTPAPAVALDANALIAAARAQTGLQDFGEPDVVEPLCVLIDAYHREANLTPAGSAGQAANLLRILSNRLYLQRDFAAHPEILQEKIRGPIVIVGLPRSGTTKLQRVIAADPALQKIPYWRMMFPAPFAADADDAAQRIAMTEAAHAYMREHFPKFQAAHPMGATEAEEEDFLMEHSLCTSLTYVSSNVPSYRDYALKRDPALYYGLLKRFLQYFQWQDRATGKPWVIKATCHLHRLRWLIDTFPDAIVVFCHRDPVTSISSIANMFCQVRSMSSDQVDVCHVAQDTLDYSAEQMRQALAQRDELENKHCFVDVGFKDIVERPIALVEKIYAAAGLELTDVARGAMAQWERDNPQHKHGRHSYDLASLGYDEAAMRRAMAHYIDRYAAYM